MTIITSRTVSNGRIVEETIRATSERLLSLRLATQDDISIAMAAGASTSDELIQHLVRQNVLTALQVDKFQKGETTGYILGQYKLLYKVAGGTFARVYRAKDLQSDGTVAVKVLRQRHLSKSENVQSFYREAQVAATFKHPNIAQVFAVAFDQPSGQHYIAMEFVEGMNLSELMKLRKRLTTAEALRLLLQMVDGLDYALSMGVTHRDIKASNILITFTGTVKIVDFGLAGVTEQSANGSGPKEQRTADYAGLERATNAPRGDRRSDIFFLGLLAFEMFAGQAPIDKPKDSAARMMSYRFSQIPKLQDLPLDVPHPIARVIDRMLELDPNRRYQDYMSLRADLLLLQDNLEAAAQADATPADLADGTSPDAIQEPAGPRVAVIHHSNTGRQRIRDKLVSYGYSVAFVDDAPGLLTQHQRSPFVAVIAELRGHAKPLVDAFSQILRERRGQQILIGLFLTNDRTHLDWVGELNCPDAYCFEAPHVFSQFAQVLRSRVPVTAAGPR